MGEEIHCRSARRPDSSKSSTSVRLSSFGDSIVYRANVLPDACTSSASNRVALVTMSAYGVSEKRYSHVKGLVLSACQLAAVLMAAETCPGRLGKLTNLRSCPSKA